MPACAGGVCAGKNTHLTLGGPSSIKNGRSTESNTGIESTLLVLNPIYVAFGLISAPHLFRRAQKLVRRNARHPARSNMITD